jgi:hypothetical protein
MSKAPPEYLITGKNDGWYLERIVQDQWSEPFPEQEHACDEAWADFVSLLAMSIRKDRSKLETYMAYTHAKLFLREQVGLSQGAEALVAASQETFWESLSEDEQTEVERRLKEILP